MEMLERAVERITAYRILLLDTGGLRSHWRWPGQSPHAAHAFAQSLFTTQDDFTGWVATGNGVSTAQTASYDFDASTTNGLGNSTAPNMAGMAGGLMINTGSNQLGFNTLAQQTPSFNLSNDSTFLSVWDPGSTAGTTSTPGTTVAYSGTMYMVYTTPTWASYAGYYSLGFLIQYPGDGYYGGAILPVSTTSGGIVDGQLTTIATYDYTVGAGATGGFGFSIFANAGTSVASSPIYIDDISMTLPVAPVINPNNATWATNGNGNWSSSPADKGNWVASAPPATANSTATFDTNGGLITVSPTVNVTGTQGTSTMTFSNPLGYTLSGPGTIIQSGPINVTAGTNTINIAGSVSFTAPRRPSPSPQTAASRFPLSAMPLMDFSPRLAAVR